MKSDVVDVMEGWGRWLRMPGGIAQGYGSNVIARLISGMPSTRCPTCGGEGTVLRDRPDGSRRRDVCPACEGSCRVNLKPASTKTSRACPHCKDIAGRSTGEVAGKTCHHCRGSARIAGDSNAHKVNPAAIPSTRGPRDDALYLRVDRVICNLPHLHQVVAWQEYIATGRQEDKLRRIGIGRSKYISTLSEIHGAVEEVLA